MIKTIIYKIKLFKMKKTLKKMKGGLEQCK
jgi:hypothetical protein